MLSSFSQIVVVDHLFKFCKLSSSLIIGSLITNCFFFPENCVETYIKYISWEDIWASFCLNNWKKFGTGFGKLVHYHLGGLVALKEFFG